MNDSPQQRVAKSKDFEAYFYCKEFVKKQLKAPSTADFASFDESRVVLLREDTYSVQTHVDAQNSFGANVRSVCLCDMKRIAEDDWRLLDITIY